MNAYLSIINEPLFENIALKNSEWSQFWLKCEDVQNKEINWVEISSYHPIVFVIELLSQKRNGFLLSDG